MLPYPLLACGAESPESAGGSAILAGVYAIPGTAGLFSSMVRISLFSLLLFVKFLFKGFLDPRVERNPFSFPIAAVTDHHRLHGLRQHFILLLWNSEVLR